MSEILQPVLPPSQACKKCNQVIFEGHAYELGEDRWHIGCFKCFKCEKLLGCNLNFLVLGNGSLVCSSCSYRCKQCGKKIDDLAILTGDQAYCSSCFKCRVCKLKIEDLRYARTSKGLFCMLCHEELIAKKKKHDLKRKQMALLALLLRPMPKEEVSALVAPGFSEASPQTVPTASAAAAHKELPPNPCTTQKPVGVPLPLKSVLEPAPQNGPLPDNPEPLMMQPPAQMLERALLGLAMPKLTPVLHKENISYEIEEVNDSDDELNNRRVREALERRLLGPDDERDTAILDLIDSFSTSNAPATINQNPEINPQAVPQAATPHVDVSALFPPNETQNFSETHGETRKNSAISAVSRDLHKVQENSPRDPPKDLTRWPAEPALSPKTLLLLSPNQFNDNEFHSASNVRGSTLPRSLSVDDIPRPRSAASSPMARANRQARVMETTDENSTVELNLNPRSTDGKFDEHKFSTPVKVLDSSLTLPLLSPPPRLSLPEVPKTPKQAEFERKNSAESRGLGLEGVDIHILHVVQHLEETMIGEADETGEADEAQAQLSPPSRKQSIRKKLLLRHKRSTSGGLSAGGFGSKLAFLKPRDDLLHLTKSHLRHFLEGSVNGQAYTTPPLPFTPPMELMSRRDVHTRSSSDTRFVISTDIDSVSRDFELRSIRSEMCQLDFRRQALLVENMKLNSEKGKLLEAVSALQKRVGAEMQNREALAREIEALTAHKLTLQRENETLQKENEGLQETTTRARAQLREYKEKCASQIYELPNETFESSSASDLLNYESAEAQKATRLKFWRRPKVTIANTHQQTSPGTSAAANTSTNVLPHLSIGILTLSTGSSKLTQGYLSAGMHMHASASQASVQNSTSGNGKGLNSFLAKSRSTTLLDSFVNVQPGPNGNEHYADVPLLTSTLQRRATFENEKVPLIVTKCIEEVEKRGLDVEGIYRLSGGNSAISAVENAFANITPSGNQDKRQMAKLNDVLGGDINAVTSALKRYLRKLPDPLIPFALYDSFIKIGQRRLVPSDFCNECRMRVINRLPPANKHALYMIGKHLDKVNQYSHVNRMNFKNLSVVFAPTIARDATGEKEMIDMGHRNETTEMLFSNFNALFSDYLEGS